MIAILSRFERFAMLWTMRVAMALLALAAAIAFYQVVTRFLFEQPSTWSEVAVRSLAVWMVYLGVAVAVRTGALMSIEFLSGRLTGIAGRVLVAAVAGLTLGVLLVMVWYGWQMVGRVRFQMLAGVDNPFTGEGISIALVYAAIPTGAALAIVGLLARASEAMGEKGRARAPAPPEILEV